MENVIQIWTFFPKSGHIIQFSKKGKRRPLPLPTNLPPPSCAPDNIQIIKYFKMNECLVMLCKNDFYSSEDAIANEAMMKHSGFPKTKQTSKSKVIFI